MPQARLARNTSLITGALTVQKVLSFIYFWFISNNLFPDQLGQYVFALSFTALFSIFIDLGLSPVLTREASKNTAQANTLLKNVMALKIPLALITLSLTWLFITISGKQVDVRMLVYLASFITLLDSFSVSFWVTFRAHHNVTYESIATILIQIIIFTIGVIALKTSGQVIGLVVALLVASIFNFFFGLTLLKTKLGYSLRPEWNPVIVRQLLALIPAFALAGVFLKIYNSADSVLLGFLVGDVAVGHFAIPAKVVTSLAQIIPGAFAAVMYPMFSYAYANQNTTLTQTFTRACTYLLIISLPLTVGIITLLPQAMSLVWPAYLDVIPNFFIMTLALPFIFLAFPTGYLLNATNRQGKNTMNRGVMTALAIILNLILIPRYGFLGAGITFLATSVVVLGLDFYWTRKVIEIETKKIGLVILKSAVSILGMTLLLLGLREQLHLLLLIPLGAITYFVILFGLKGFSLHDLHFLKNKA